MRGLGVQALRVIGGVVMLLTSAFSQSADWLGVATPAGRVWLNEELLWAESTVSSGDRLCTGKNSIVAFVAGLHETFKLDPNSCVVLGTEGDSVVITLEVGALHFLTIGHTRVIIGEYGFSIGSPTHSLAFARVELLRSGDVEVWARRGSVALSGGGETILVPAGESVVAAPQAETEEEEPESEPPATG